MGTWALWTGLGLVFHKMGRRLGQGTFTVGTLVSDVDFVTALCSQVVYEGLVDDTFRIKCGKWPHPPYLGQAEVATSLWCLP